jgi:glycosyltransferase involved in cell wall biosynthesis
LNSRKREISQAFNDSRMVRPDILVFAPSRSGGIAEHIFYQCRSLDKAGAKILCLASSEFLPGRDCTFPIQRILAVPTRELGSRFFLRLRHAAVLVINQLRLAWWVQKTKPRLVLWDSYSEHLAPLWIWTHVLLSRIFGVRYASNLHDPVRDYRMGPKWWHDLSVRLAYLPLDFVLIHDTLPVPSPVPPRVRTYQVPVGVYDLPPPEAGRDETRKRWGIQPGQTVLFSFGYVRDGKNLDLVIRALRTAPGVTLVVAGTVASTKEKPFAFYRDLARQEGVEDRIRLCEGFVSNEELGSCFGAADFALLTYSAAFRSQSGVLNLAARARVPVLASASPGPLIDAVKQFGLGVTIQPDSLEAIIDGLGQLLIAKLQPRWEDYEAFADWDANARGIMEAAGLRCLGLDATAGDFDAASKATQLK